MAEEDKKSTTETPKKNISNFIPALERTMNDMGKSMQQLAISIGELNNAFNNLNNNLNESLNKQFRDLKTNINDVISVVNNAGSDGKRSNTTISLLDKNGLKEQRSILVDILNMRQKMARENQNGNKATDTTIEKNRQANLMALQALQKQYHAAGILKWQEFTRINIGQDLDQSDMENLISLDEQKQTQEIMFDKIKNLQKSRIDLEEQYQYAETEAQKNAISNLIERIGLEQENLKKELKVESEYDKSIKEFKEKYKLKKPTLNGAVNLGYNASDKIKNGITSEGIGTAVNPFFYFNWGANKLRGFGSEALNIKQKELTALSEKDEGLLTVEERTRKAKLTKDTRRIKEGMMALNVVTGAMNTFKNLASSCFKAIGIDISSIFSSIAEEIKSILNANTGAATYGLSTSLFSNSGARDQAMKYGLSDSQNYAFTQAKDMLNIGGDDDLMYMNDNQKTIFNNLMTKYSNWYDEMESTGMLQNIQEAQLEFKMFKQEIAMKLLNWFSKHTGTIEAVMNLTMNALEWGMNALTDLLNLFGVSTESSYDTTTTSDYTNNNSSYNNQKYINIKTDTSINTTMTQAQASTFASNNNDQLTKALINAINAS